MHSPLFLDELLREIIFHCYESDRSTLTSVARTCKGWRDPALDTLWRRLPSLGPLLLLIPGVSFKNEEYIYTNHPLPVELVVFKKYACRVKHMNNRQSLKVHPTLVEIIPFLCLSGPSIPNLATTSVSIPRCNSAVIPLIISSNLNHLDIDLGFKNQPAIAIEEYLDQVVEECPKLRSMGIRGLASEHVNQTISAMQNLQYLSLRLGNSLLPESLHTIKEFPHLLELELHAGHLTPQDTMQGHLVLPYGTFPMLQKLRIRAKSHTVEDILHYLQPDTLRHLNIELDDMSPSPTLWSKIVERIGSKGANSLLHLTLEHHFEVLEPPSSLSTHATQQGHHGLGITSSSTSFEAFRTLASLRNLRHFACDLTDPPFIFDEDVKRLIEFWPHIEHLELGPIPCFFEDDTHSQLTAGILAFVATMAPKLERLVLPLIIDEDLPAIFPLAQNNPSNRLYNLTVAGVNAKPTHFGDFLIRLFPSLDDVQPWIDINAALQKLGSHCSQ